MARFVAVYDRTLGAYGRGVDQVDLRYTNGFAVRFSDPRQGTAQPRRGKGAGA